MDFFFLCKNIFLPAQNLVPNPSFEDIEVLPISTDQLQCARYWFNPTGGTPDLFHTETLADAQLPTPLWVRTKTYPKTGKACAGIVSTTHAKMHEYIGVKLTKTIKKGENVKVRFYYTNGINGTVGGLKTKLGAFFSKEKINLLSEKILTQIPQIQSENPLFATIWTLFEMDFVAEADFNYVYIGNFSDTPFLPNETGGRFDTWAYYFIDDVEINACF